MSVPCSVKNINFLAFSPGAVAQIYRRIVACYVYHNALCHAAAFHITVLITNLKPAVFTNGEIDNGVRCSFVARVDGNTRVVVTEKPVGAVYGYVERYSLVNAKNSIPLLRICIKIVKYNVVSYGLAVI